MIKIIFFLICNLLILIILENKPVIINPFYSLNKPILSLNRNNSDILLRGRRFVDKCMSSQDINSYSYPSI